VLLLEIDDARKLSIPTSLSGTRWWTSDLFDLFASERQADEILRLASDLRAL
jgi:hypothetical protein